MRVPELAVVIVCCTLGLLPTAGQAHEALPSQDQVKIGSLRFTPPPGWTPTRATSKVLLAFAPPDLPAGKICQVRVFADEVTREVFSAWYTRRWNALMGGKPNLRTSEVIDQKVGPVDLKVRSGAYQESGGESYALIIACSVQGHFVLASYEANDYPTIDKHQTEIYTMFETMDLGAGSSSPPVNPGGDKPPANPDSNNKPPVNPTTPKPAEPGHPAGAVGAWTVFAYLPPAAKDPSKQEDMPMYMTLFGSDRAIVGYPTEGFDNFDVAADVGDNPDRWLKVDSSSAAFTMTNVRSQTTSWTRKPDGSVQSSDGKLYLPLSPVKALGADITLKASDTESLKLGKDGTVTDSGLLATLGMTAATAPGSYTLGKGSILLHFDGRPDTRIVFLQGPDKQMLFGGSWVTRG